MKKLLVLVFLSVFLSSCFWKTTNKTDLDKAKDDLLSWNTWSVVKTENNTQTSTWSSTWSLSWTGQIEKVEKTEEKKNIELNYLTEEKFVELDNLTISDFRSLEKEITWKTLVNVDKIVVSFSNSSSKFPSDSFQLKKFKAWDKTFMYRAFKKYETLDYWENIYVIEAYSGDKVSKLQLKVNLPTEEQIDKEAKDFDKEKQASEPISTKDLPTSSIFWTPKELWNWKITYSDVKWLEVEKIWSADLTNDTDSVTKFLNSRLKSLFYWNSKRPISGEDWISFFVVRIEWDKYFYEKHYYIWWYYWVLSLLQWDFKNEWTMEEKTKTLSELNTSLREKNSSFPMVKIADTLFQSFKK